MIVESRLLDRFLRYVRIGTAADPTSTAYPSSSGQWELGRLLAKELVECGAEEVHQDNHGLVWATLPSTAGPDLPTVALIAHLDTSAEAPGSHVNPQVVEAYNGGKISLENGTVIDPADSPTLAGLVGKTLITTDGTTLLGADDKAGVAIIMELAQHLIERPHLPHGPVKILFTCDEEIGRGTDKIDLDKLGATAAYTLDGGGAGMIDVETFSADAMRVRFIGHNIHPAIAKGRMVNSLRGAAAFVEALPKRDTTPETTSDRLGFIHVHDIHGGVGQCDVDLILRSFEAAELDTFADLITATAKQVVAESPGLQVEFQRRRQYRNLAEGLRKLPAVVDLAILAFERLGRPYQTAIVRGGTDGSQLTEKGLPTPNLSSGQHNIHSVQEFACLEEMTAAAEHMIELLGLWSDQRS
ncbi:MAG: peptidase T [Planctomycetaceae bacterium]|nr:MAG: peptidase T [Planctomycetaceae bacterium]